MLSLINDFDASKEFIPVSLRNRPELRKAKEVEPIFLIWDNDRIRRLKVGITSTIDCDKKSAVDKKIN